MLRGLGRRERDVVVARTCRRSALPTSHDRRRLTSATSNQHRQTTTVTGTIRPHCTRTDVTETFRLVRLVASAQW